MSIRVTFAVAFVGLLSFVSLVYSKPQFESKDAKATAAWTAKVWEPVDAAFKSGNALARIAAEKKAIQEITSTVVNKDIDWIVEVNSVDQNGIKLSPITTSEKFIAMTVITPFNKTNPQANAKPFAIPNGDWVLTLKLGSKIRLQGKIAAFQGYGNNDYNFTYFVTNPKLSPAP